MAIHLTRLDWGLSKYLEMAPETNKEQLRNVLWRFNHARHGNESMSDLIRSMIKVYISQASGWQTAQSIEFSWVAWLAGYLYKDNTVFLLEFLNTTNFFWFGTSQYTIAVAVMVKYAMRFTTDPDRISSECLLMLGPELWLALRKMNIVPKVDGMPDEIGYEIPFIVTPETVGPTMDEFTEVNMKSIIQGLRDRMAGICDVSWDRDIPMEAHDASDGVPASHLISGVCAQEPERDTKMTEDVTLSFVNWFDQSAAAQAGYIQLSPDSQMDGFRLFGAVR
jgi:hypothetical protein